MTQQGFPDVAIVQDKQTSLMITLSLTESTEGSCHQNMVPHAITLW